MRWVAWTEISQAQYMVEVTAASRVVVMATTMDTLTVAMQVKKKVPQTDYRQAGKQGKWREPRTDNAKANQLGIYMVVCQVVTMALLMALQQEKLTAADQELELVARLVTQQEIAKMAYQKEWKWEY